MNVDEFLRSRIAARKQAVVTETPQTPFWRCDVGSLAERQKMPSDTWNWRQYLQAILLDSGLCCFGFIADAGTLEVLANTCDSVPTPQELRDLLTVIRRRRRGRLTLCDRQWRVEVADGGRGVKCVGGEVGAPEGLTAARSRTKIVVGWHNSSQDPALCNLVVCNLADFFSARDF